MFQTAELRKWWREGKKIWGHVYNDPDDFWDNGELGEFEPVIEVDCGQFIVVHTHGKTIFKLDKDEERKKS